MFKKIKQPFLYWLARRLPACDEILPTISQSMDRKLTLRQRISLRLHLNICLWCMRYADQLFLIRCAIHKHDSNLSEQSEPSLPEEARDRIKRSLTR